VDLLVVCPLCCPAVDDDLDVVYVHQNTLNCVINNLLTPECLFRYEHVEVVFFPVLI
jgi:hypothetical protein